MKKSKYKLCKIINKNHYLPDILSRAKLSDYQDLNSIFSSQEITFSNNNMDESTIVSLTNSVEKEIEDHINKKHTRILAVIGASTGIISLVIDAIQLFL